MPATITEWMITGHEVIPTGSSQNHLGRSFVKKQDPNLIKPVDLPSIYKTYGSKGTIVFFLTYIINFRKILDIESVND